MGRDEKACPRCGRFFSSVLCPKCGYSAAPSRFIRGCPVCGHAGALDAPGAPAYESAAGRGPAAPLPWRLWLAGLGILAAALVGLAVAVLR